MLQKVGDADAGLISHRPANALLAINSVTLDRAIEASYQRAGYNVLVFCSSSNTIPDAYQNAAHELGTLLGEGGHNLVWGGGDSGAMGTLSRAAKNAGALLLGVNHGFEDAPQHAEGDHIFSAKNTTEGNNAMRAMSRFAVALAGGLGTFDEVTSYLVGTQYDKLMPPIVLLNTNGFYDGTVTQLQRMSDEGFLGDVDLNALMHVANTPLEVVDFIAAYRGPQPGNAKL